MVLIRARRILLKPMAEVQKGLTGAGRSPDGFQRFSVPCTLALMCVGLDLCVANRIVETMMCGFWTSVIKDTAASTLLSLGSLVPGKASRHLLTTLRSPMGKDWDFPHTARLLAYRKSFPPWKCLLQPSSSLCSLCHSFFCSLAFCEQMLCCLYVFPTSLCRSVFSASFLIYTWPKMVTRCWSTPGFDQIFL